MSTNKRCTSILTARVVNVLLGPNVGPLGRIPLGGRNWEGFSVDPYLTGQLSAESIIGHQEAGVIANVKVSDNYPGHLLLFILTCYSISSPMSKRHTDDHTSESKQSLLMSTTRLFTNTISGPLSTPSELVLPRSCARTTASTALMLVKTAS